MKTSPDEFIEKPERGFFDFNYRKAIDYSNKVGRELTDTEMELFRIRPKAVKVKVDRETGIVGYAN